MWIGGVHADEFAALYSSLKLIKHLLNDSHEQTKNIVFVPLLNIDGLLKGIKKEVTHIERMEIELT